MRLPGFSKKPFGHKTIQVWTYGGGGGGGGSARSTNAKVSLPAGAGGAGGAGGRGFTIVIDLGEVKAPERQQAEI